MNKVFFLIFLSILVVSCKNPSSEDDKNRKLLDDLLKDYSKNKSETVETKKPAKDPVQERIDNYTPSKDSADVALCIMAEIYKLKYYSKKDKKELTDRFKSLVEKGEGADCMCEVITTRKTLGGRIPIVKNHVQNYKTSKGGLVTPMHMLAMSGELDLMKILVADSADLNKPSSTRFYPLDMAMKTNQKEMIDYLLKNGADPKLVKLSSSEDIKIIEKLAKLGADSSTVHVGFAIENRSLLKKLLAFKPDLNAVKYDVFWWNKHPENVKLLLDNGLSPLAKEITPKNTILHQLVWNNDTELVLMLLDYVKTEEEIKQISESKGMGFNTILEEAKSRGNDEIIKKLNALGVN